MIPQRKVEQLLNTPKIIEGRQIDITKLEQDSKIQKKLFFLDEIFRNEEALLNISQGHISFKYTFQTRIRKTIVLVRIDFYGFHTNPVVPPNFNTNDRILNRLMQRYSNYVFRREPHIHYYISNYDDKWAFPLYEFQLEEKRTLIDNLINFFERFNIELPDIVRGIFNGY